MLSVAIPIYNVVVTKLITALSNEIKLKQLPVEIVLIDDCSTSDIKVLNEEICKPYTYIQLSQNVGRSQVRNLFIRYTLYDYLLFLDCDSLIDNPDFLETYLSYIKAHTPDVICGGRRYPKTCPGRSSRLSWRYGRECESKSAAQRAQYANRSFMTNNFVIKKSILRQIPFDQRISTYGHEDTLLGFRLMQQNIIIQHIDNEVINNDIETNVHFLHKSETAIQNLLKILDFVEDKPHFIEMVTLLRYVYQLKKYPVQLKLTQVLYHILKPILKWSLINGFVSITLFNFYKLGYCLKFDKLQKKQLQHFACH